MDEMDNDLEVIENNYDEKVREIKYNYRILVMKYYNRLNQLKIYYENNKNPQSIVNIREEEEQIENEIKRLTQIANIELRKARTDYYNRILNS